MRMDAGNKHLSVITGLTKLPYIGENLSACSPWRVAPDPRPDKDTVTDPLYLKTELYPWKLFDIGETDKCFHLKIKLDMMTSYPKLLFLFLDAPWMPENPDVRDVNRSVCLCVHSQVDWSLIVLLVSRRKQIFQQITTIEACV